MSLSWAFGARARARNSLSLGGHRTQSKIVDREGIIIVSVQFGHRHSRLSAGQAARHLSQTSAFRIVVLPKANIFDRALVERVSPPIAI